MIALSDTTLFPHNPKLLNPIHLISPNSKKLNTKKWSIAHVLYFHTPYATTLEIPSQSIKTPTLIPKASHSSLQFFYLNCICKTKTNPLSIPKPELANSIPTGPAVIVDDQEPVSEANKWVVLALYEALNARDVDKVHKLLASDIEWWFHGPPTHQHMMRLLTGTSPEDKFRFVPLSIAAFGPTVFVEGSDESRSMFWVHAWTVNSDEIITQVREYFNTNLTVTRLGDNNTSTAAAAKKRLSHCLPVWQSRLAEGAGKSLPGLVLAL